MSKFKMIVTDMDYTLLGKDKTISERNKQAIKKASQKGIKIVIATGRIYTSAKVYAKLIGIDTPIIASNGAIIRQDHTNNTIFQSILPDEIIREMIAICHKNEVYCHLYTSKTVYAEKLTNISNTYNLWNENLAKEDKIDIQINENLEEVIKAEKGNILKAVVVDKDENKVKSIRNEILKTGMVSVSQSLKNNLEVMNTGVSKGNAIKILSEIYKINREEIMSFGDNENDISMIEYAGLGIAMKNAEECLKCKADYITDDCDSDGVALAIEKFVLNN